MADTDGVPGGRSQVASLDGTGECTNQVERLLLA
jgi:hypothetical protein